MDLAKIRQKSRQEFDTVDPEDTPRSPDNALAASVCPDGGEVNQVLDDKDFFENIEPAAAVASFQPYQQQDAPMPRRAVRGPLEAILAGRAKAGCDEILPEPSTEQPTAETADYREYLCFRVSDEVYGVSIMEIKELIKPREVTEVPRAPSFVSGVISLRGVIIPIIDMLDRLGLTRESVTGRERVIVVRHGDSFSGLLVDEIIQVVRIAADCIEAAPTVLDGIDRDFVKGIGRSAGRMIILLNLETITDIHLY